MAGLSVSHESELAEACEAANADSRLAEEIEEWQAFDDALLEVRDVLESS